LQAKATATGGSSDDVTRASRLNFSANCLFCLICSQLQFPLPRRHIAETASSTHDPIGDTAFKYASDALHPWDVEATLCWTVCASRGGPRAESTTARGAITAGVSRLQSTSRKTGKAKTRNPRH